jgi:hypothetical protein
LSEAGSPAPYAIDCGDIDRDREVMLALWRGNLGDEGRMQLKFDWFYADCPWGTPSVCLLRHVADGTHVGIASAGPRRMLAAGAPIGAGVLVDLGVAAQHRSLGPALMLQSALAESAGRRFQLLYGFPNPKAAPVFKRVGHARLTEIVRHARVLRHARYLRRRLPRPLAMLAGIALDLGARVRDAWRSRSDPRWQARWSERADPRFDSLWQRSMPDHGIFAVRDQAFARWRFDACPFEKTRYLLLSDGDELQAWFACQTRDGALHVRDFWSAQAAVGMDRAHADALLHAARAAGHESVSVEIAGRPTHLAGWQAAGFSPRGKRPVFGRWTDADMPVELELYLTSADEDE